MRILHVGKYYPPFEGGIENFLASLLKGTTKENLSHCVLAHHHQPWRSTSREVLPEGIVVRSFICCRLLFAPIAPFFYFHLKRLLAEFRPDVIHVHMPNLSAFWLLLPGRRFDTPLVVHWHADVIPSRKNPLLSLAYVLYRPLEKKLLARADAVIVTSAPYLESSRPLQAFRDKCHVIPLGLEDSGREKTADLSAPGQENEIGRAHV